MQKYMIANKLLSEKEFDQKKVKIDCLPQNIAIYTTDVCNLRCIACHYGQKTASPISISAKGYQRVFDVFPYLQTVGIAGAEMFFDSGNWKGFMQRVFQEGRKYPQIKFAGFTNGTLLTSERINFIFEKFKWIGISIDSPNSNVYKTIRIGADLDHVIRNIKKISELKKRKNRHIGDEPEIIISSVITEKTYKSVIKLVDLAHEVGAVAVHYQDPWEGTYINENIFMDKGKTSQYRFLRQQAARKAKAVGISVLDRTRNSIVKNFPDLEESPEELENISVNEWPNCCDAPWRELYIWRNGDVQVCCTSKTVLGNINEQSISEIWNSSPAISLRRQILSGDYVKNCKPRCYRGYFLPLHKRRKFVKRFKNLIYDRKRLKELFSDKKWLTGVLLEKKRLVDLILDRRE